MEVSEVYLLPLSSLQTQFDITVASEIMAILALTTDLQDMRKRFVLSFLFLCGCVSLLIITTIIIIIIIFVVRLHGKKNLWKEKSEPIIYPLTGFTCCARDSGGNLLDGDWNLGFHIMSEWPSS